MKKTQGFTLVELSIVLVILGLLVGGVLSGQSLIRAAELRSVSTEFSRYKTAINSFQDKYFALPGDMNSATKFWGTAIAGTDCITTASSDKKTCDGNGDNILQPSTNSNEVYRFWQHLANAGLIEGSYDGITHGTNAYSSTAANSPRGKIGSSLWFTWNWNAPALGAGTWFDGDYGNRLSFGGERLDGEPSNLILKPEEAWNIDSKLDDGQPGRGILLTNWNANCTEATASSQLDAKYNLVTAAKSCFLNFPKAF